ncbi:MAG TPA: NAD(P)/FAD-dependent oxidoreductase [Burkholderiales bacterium]
MKLDAIVVGAGHNGLACACYLARGGLKVKVLERRPVVGGAAVSEEFHPGFRNSVAAYTVSLLQPKVIAELRLASHGLRIVERPVANFLPLDGGYLMVGGGADTAAQVARFSRRDAERLPAYWATVERVADVLRELVLRCPPNAGGGVHDLLRALGAGRLLRRLDMEARRDLLAFFTRSAAELLDGWFESEPIKAVYGFDAVVGNYASPCHPGTGYVLLHHVFGEVNGKRGAWGHAIGGMGAITQAMAAEARRLGVEIECGAPVERISHGKVFLKDGRELAGKAIVANVNPRLLYLELVDRSELPPEFVARMARYKCGSGTFRMNVALSRLPRFACLPEPGPHHGAGIIMAPSLAYMDRAYLEARAEGMSRQPIVEMVIPSTLDDTLAPRGAHVASLFCQHFDPQADWASRKDEAVRRIFDVVESHAPGFRASVLGYSALSPADLEREFGLVGGDIFHGALSLDQLWWARPLLGYADYRGPLKGLYLCGSGAHPGGGVTGAPGRNCAREVLRDFGRRLRG